MRGRRAISIAELLVVMSACSVVLTMSAALIHRIMHIQSDSRAYYDEQRSALRLSRQLRTDIREATNADIELTASGASSLLRLQLPDGSAVEYGQTETAVLRSESLGGETEDREEFEFASRIDFTAQKQASPPCVVVTVNTKQNDAAGPTSGDLHVVATLDRAAAASEVVGEAP